MLLLVDKPSGYTSYDIIRKIKKIFHKEKVGHSGTLDPMATGLLIIGLGKSTKKLTDIIGLDKEYIAEIDFSKITDTWDLDYFDLILNYELGTMNGSGGIFINDKFKEAPSIGQIREKLDLLIPEYDLPLPNFSAKKVDGKKLYDLARKGENLNLYRKMKTYNYDIISYDFPILKLRLNVGSGTYIRSIAYWLGQQFGLGGILISLHRTRIGDFSL